MSQRASAKADDVLTALRVALTDLLGQEVDLRGDLPDGLEVSDVRVTIEAVVGGDGESSPADDIVEVETVEEQAVEEAVEEGDDIDETAPARPSGDEPSLDDEADVAADFMEGLLDAMDLPGHLKIRIIDEEDQAEIEVVDVGGGVLIGRRGQTLESIQELLRSAMQREFQQRSRVRVDVEGYRARRIEKLLEKAEEAIAIVVDTGESQRLEPMDVFERKAVHRLVGQHDGVASRSQGREPGRRVVIEAE